VANPCDRRTLKTLLFLATFHFQLSTLIWLLIPLYAENRRRRVRRRANESQRKLEKNKGIWEDIESKLMNKEEDWSPDTIIGRMRKERIVTVVERKSRYVRMENRACCR
jgi:IS30 family transposase